MGYNIENGKNLIAQTEYLGGEVDNIKHYAKDKFTLVDKEGNKVYYELQSVQQLGGNQFRGYLVAMVNADCEDFNKILQSAKQYFAKNPNERFSQINSDVSIVHDYTKILVKEAAQDSFRRRYNKENGRKETNLEKMYLYQNSYIQQVNQDPENLKFLSWEQIAGIQDFGDDQIDQSRQSIAQDNMNEKTKDAIFGKAWEESADRGEKSLREKMKRDSIKAKITTDIQNDKRIMHISKSTSDIAKQTFDEDEKNALVRYAVTRRQFNDK